MQATGGQGFIDLLAKGLVFVHVVVGLGEVQVTGAAGGQERIGAIGLFFGQRQVAGDQSISRYSDQGKDIRSPRSSSSLRSLSG